MSVTGNWNIVPLALQFHRQVWKCGALKDNFGKTTHMAQGKDDPEHEKCQGANQVGETWLSCTDIWNYEPF